MITVFTNANILDVIGETTIKNGSVLVEGRSGRKDHASRHLQLPRTYVL